MGVLLSWSSGKDSALALVRLHDQGADVVGLLTTFNEAFGRSAMHAVRRELVEAQADAAGLPLSAVDIPWPCPNGVYEERTLDALGAARGRGVTHVAYGDLYLQDVRAYRCRLLEGTGLEPLFPVWAARERTPALAREMIDLGFRAVVTCVDPRQLDRSFAGRWFDAAFLRDLPPGVDPCGENGEFHTFCADCPAFARPVPVRVGDVVERDGFVFADVLAPE